MHYQRPYQLDVSWQGTLALTPTHLHKQTWRRPLWRMIAAFEVILTVDGKQAEFTIPEGYVTDGASVPWVVSWLVPQTEDTWAPAVIHDVLYSARGWNRMSKRVCDALFGLALIKQNVPAWRVAAMFEAVRWGGHGAWRDSSPIDDFNRAEGLIPVAPFKD